MFLNQECKTYKKKRTKKLMENMKGARNDMYFLRLYKLPDDTIFEYVLYYYLYLWF